MLNSRDCSAADSMLSLTTARVRIMALACDKVASYLGLGGGFRRELRFLSPLTTTQSGISPVMTENLTIFEIPNFMRSLQKYHASTHAYVFGVKF